MTVLGIADNTAMSDGAKAHTTSPAPAGSSAKRDAQSDEAITPGDME